MATKIEINTADRDKLVEIFQQTKVENYTHDISAEYALFTRILKLKAIRENYNFTQYEKVLTFFKENGLHLYLKDNKNSTPSSSLYAFLSHAFQHPEVAMDNNNTIKFRTQKKSNSTIAPQTYEETENTFKGLKEQILKDIEVCSERNIPLDNFEDLDVNNNKIGCSKCISGYILNENGKWDFCECYLKDLLITKYRKSGIKDEYINIHTIKEDLIEFTAKKSFNKNKNEFKGIQLTDFINKFNNNIEDLLDNGWNLIIEGPTGAFKTTTACLIGKNAIKNGFSTLFIEMQQLRKIWILDKLTPELESSKEKLLNVDLLIIDDFGQEFMSSNSDFQLSELDSLLRERNALQKSIIITTNATPENLNQRYGERIYSLLKSKMIHLYIKSKEDIRGNHELPDYLS